MKGPHPVPVPNLDLKAIFGHSKGVKTLLLLLISTLASAAQQQGGNVANIPERNIVPMEVKQRAQKATQAVVDKTIRGDFKAALDSMNPEFVKVTSRPYGGPDKYKAGLLKQMQAMGKNGVTFMAAITRLADIAFEVDYGLRDKHINGKPILDEEGNPIQEAVYRSWMVFVPTVKDFLVVDPEDENGELRKFRKWSFEVVIADKRDEKWSLINGDNINALQLRKLFPYLPKDDKKLQFPPIKIEEIKKK